MIDKSIYAGERIVMLGKLNGGFPIHIEFEDKGDSCPGFAADGSRYLAFTSWMRFIWPNEAKPPTHWPEKPGDSRGYLENYSQTDCIEAERSGDPMLFRLYRDLATLVSMQVDVATLEIAKKQAINDREAE